MGLDQFVIHVAGVTGCVTKPLQTLNIRQCVQQTAQRPVFTVCTLPMIGIDVLPQEGHFGNPSLDQGPGFTQHAGNGPGKLGTTRVRHYAEGTELVASFLYSQEGCAPSGDGFFLLCGRQGIKLVFNGKVGFDNPSGTV